MLAFSVLAGLRPDDFWGLTPGELAEIQFAHRKQKEAEELREWERIRWQTAVLLNVHLKNPVTLEKLLPLSSDPKPKPPTKIDTSILDRIDQAEKEGRVKKTVYNG